MNGIIRTLAFCLLSTVVAMPISAAPKVKGTVLKPSDVRACMGLQGSNLKAQIAACDRVIASGKIKKEHIGDYYATRGSAYLKLGALNKALLDLDKAIASRASAEAHFERGMVHFLKKDSTKADADFAKTIKMKPAFAPAYLFSGLVDYQNGDFAGALANFDLAVQRTATYAEAIFARGAAKKKTGDATGGAKDMAQAESMRPGVAKQLALFGVKP